MKIGIGIPNQVRGVRGAVIPQWARRAEAAGFSALSTTGRIAYPGVMDTVALAAAAGATTRIRLISSVLLGPVWPPLLVAKEVQGIDAVSGGRLTLGLGLGGRADDFVVPGLRPAGAGARLDRDIATYRHIWNGGTPDGCDNAPVAKGAREIPLLFGGRVKESYERVARFGTGYIGGPVRPAGLVDDFDGVRAAWRRAGRDGRPHLVAVAYFAFGDAENGRGNVYDYFATSGDRSARIISGRVCGSADAARAVLRACEDVGADELIFNPATDDPDEVDRLAGAVL